LHTFAARCQSATWFDLSPRNVERKLGTKSEIAKLVHMVFKVAQGRIRCVLELWLWLAAHTIRCVLVLLLAAHTICVHTCSCLFQLCGSSVFRWPCFFGLVC